MTTYYTLSDGSKISLFFWEDFYTPNAEKHIHDNGVWHNYAEVTEYDENGKPKRAMDIKYKEMANVVHQKLVHVDENKRRYIEWKGQIVYLEDWDYTKMRMLIECINYAKFIKDRWFVREDEALGSFMKQPDKWGIRLHPRVLEVMIPGTSIGIVSEPKKELMVEFIPDLNDKIRPVHNWFYKIKFIPKVEELRKCVGSETFYFSDFWSLVMSGHIELFEIGREE